MDPNETLRLLRLTAKQMAVEDTPVGGVGTSPTFVQHARDLAEYVESLDEWLSNGGFAPSAWTNDVTKGLLRDLVGDHCPSHAEHEPSCSTCIAVLVSA